MKPLSRRRLVRAGLAVPLAVAHSAAAGAAHPVVFVRLRGGADALSLVVPYRNDDYHRARATMRLDASATVALDGEYGLHPSLRCLLPLFDNGELGAVVGAGFAERYALHGEASAALDDAIVAATGGAPPVIELDGWDTHAAQAARIPVLLGELGDRLLALRAAMAADWGRSSIVVVSEFGRGLRETVLGGTDDGHAQTVLVLRGARDQGRVRGVLTWGERGLAPTTDLGAVLVALVAEKG